MTLRVEHHQLGETSVRLTGKDGNFPSFPEFPRAAARSATLRVGLWSSEEVSDRVPPQFPVWRFIPDWTTRIAERGSTFCFPAVATDKFRLPPNVVGREAVAQLSAQDGDDHLLPQGRLSLSLLYWLALWCAPRRLLRLCRLLRRLLGRLLCRLLGWRCAGPGAREVMAIILSRSLAERITNPPSHRPAHGRRPVADTTLLAVGCETSSRPRRATASEWSRMYCE